MSAPKPIETLWAVYVVSDEYGATVERRHTMLSEAKRTLGATATRLERRPGFKVELRRETWQGSKMLAWEKVGP